MNVFIQRNFAADVFRQKLNFTGKTAKLRFVPPFGGLRAVRGIVHGLSMARWKARGRLPISAEHFSLAVTVEALRADIGRNRCVRKGVGHFERKFQGEWGVTRAAFRRLVRARVLCQMQAPLQTYNPRTG